MTETPEMLFMTSEQAGVQGKVFGTRYNGRYHLPLLPGEEGTKSGGDWVPRGVQSATNLAGSISETRALGIWERERTQLGLALRDDLRERMVFAVMKAMRAGLDLDEKLRSTELGKELQDELALIHEEARAACKANAGAIRGTNRHNVWEHLAATGELLGTPQINAEIIALDNLMTAAGLERVPGLQERVVRNVALNAAGRFDDILRTTRDIEWQDPQRCPSGFSIPAGTLLMADLKSSRNPFWSWLEVRIQLAVYATAEWMLNSEHEYVPGPKHHVSQEWGVVLHMPSDGKPPALKRINIQAGVRAARLARQVCEERAEGKSVATHAEAEWPT